MTLEQRIQRLEHIEEIRRLRNRYHACLNERRYAECRALFTEDAVVELGYLARYEGLDAIDRGFRARWVSAIAFSSSSSFTATTSKSTATPETGTSHALEARYGRYGVSYVVAGRYDDVYKLVDGVWKFQSMIAELFYTVPNAVGWTGE